MSGEDSAKSEALGGIRNRFTDPSMFLSPQARASVQAQRDAALTRQYLSGDDLYETLVSAVDDLNSRAPAEHDVLVEAFGIYVLSVEFRAPHAFLFRGHDGNGNETSVVAHFSQLVCSVVYLPKKGNDRVITGFSRTSAEADK